jgi:NADH:ubiquinone oxidoreductase subunit F (NADH-binding)
MNATTATLAAAAATTAAAAAAPVGERRLLDGSSRRDLAAHLARYGPLPSSGRADVLALVEAAGLTGRGGAGFPTSRKLRAVAAGRGPAVVVANGTESEPASGKDRVLMTYAPHLVLDGAQLAAAAVGATRAYVHAVADETVLASLHRALDERRGSRLDRVPVTVTVAEDRFVAGQETAVVAQLAGGPALPRFARPPVYARGVDGRPTLVQNVETLAHLALLARFGAPWFRSVGTPDDPGTRLVTVGGAVARPGVVEVASGTTARALLGRAGGPAARPEALLVGGYHGTWLPAEAVLDVPLVRSALAAYDANPGAGLVAVLPAGRCGLVETARVVRYLADQGARQCGPCVHGLAAVADAFEQLAAGRPQRRTVADLQRWCGILPGRGACAHPDGTVRLVRSALRTFADEVGRHEAGRCSGSDPRPVLPVPNPGGRR